MCGGEKQSCWRTIKIELLKTLSQSISHAIYAFIWECWEKHKMWFFFLFSVCVKEYFAWEIKGLTNFLLSALLLCHLHFLNLYQLKPWGIADSFSQKNITLRILMKEDLPNYSIFAYLYHCSLEKNVFFINIYIAYIYHEYDTVLLIFIMNVVLFHLSNSGNTEKS